MRIIVNLNGYYDWDPAADDYEPAKEDVLALRAKQDAKGKWLVKKQVSNPTYTEVSIHESEIENCSEHFERIGNPKTREAVVAWYLEEKVMPQHAAQADWISIEVEKEPKVEAYLNNRFGLTKTKKENKKDGITLSNTSS